MLQFLEKKLATRGYKLIRSEDTLSIPGDDPHGRKVKNIKLVSHAKYLAFWLFILSSVGMNMVLLNKSKHRSEMGRSPFSKSSVSSFTKV